MLDVYKHKVALLFGLSSWAPIISFFLAYVLLELKLHFIISPKSLSPRFDVFKFSSIPF
jgi:hypothetical protein